MRARRGGGSLAAAALALAACGHPHTTINPPCRPGDKCAEAPPPESEEQQWAVANRTMAEGIAEIRAACGTEVQGTYDRETWANVPYPRGPSVLMVRAAGHEVEQATHELAEVCRVGDEDDRAAVRSIRELVVHYRPGGAPAELSGEGTLVLFVDPTTDADPYLLRRQFGWKWR